MFRYFDRLVNLYQVSSLFSNYTPNQNMPAKKPWLFIWQNLAGFWPLIFISFALTIISASLEVWLIGYAGKLVDKLNQTPPLEVWQKYGNEFMMIIGLVIILRPIVQWLREGLNDMVFRPNIVARVRWQLHNYVTQHSLEWFQNDMAGSIAGHVRDAGSSTAGAAYQILQTLCYVMVYIIASIFLVAQVDNRLVWPLLIWLIIYFGLLVYAIPKFERMSEKFQHAYSVLNGLLVDTYSNMAIVKLFTSMRAEDRHSQQKIEDTRVSFIDLQHVEVLINIGFLFISSLLMVGMVGYSIVLWQSGIASLGLVATSVTLSLRISSMAEWLMDGLSSLYGFIGGLKDSLKLLAQPIDILDVPHAAALEFKGGAIEFKNIEHHYGQKSGGLNGLSLSIKAGEKIGLVGRSGAGKSTLVNLLLRFYEAELGEISIDGQDICHIKQVSLRHNIGIMMQDATLLHCSIAENIGLGQPKATKESIELAAQRAGAHEFILSLADVYGNRAYQVQVGERGVNLSGGQRQRIALARTMLKNAPILILDEATSALDSETEAQIQQALNDMIDGKTVIAIAHRLTTLAQMDRIIVMDKGRIVEQGCHEELLDNCGIYAQLWALQSDGYIGDR